MDLTETGQDVDWTHQDKDRCQWQALVHTTLTLQVLQNAVLDKPHTLFQGVA